MSDGITVTRPIPGVAVVSLARPPVNALSSQLYRDLIVQLTGIGADPDVHAVVVGSASPNIFCAGADIKELRGLSGGSARTLDEQRQSLAREVFDTILNLPQPTVAAVNGPAIGAGAVIASCCDIRIGSRQSSFVLPEINIARCGGGRHLMRHLPQGTVRLMFFTGQPLPGHEAHRLGFLQELVEVGSELDRALELAAYIATKSPLALRVGKQALNLSEFLPVSDGYAVEQEHTLRLARSADAVEATQAFLEKRSPRFGRLQAP
ncbi:enoyl-CoA hydratase-related protein [Dactylosporangium fulvum]|uniref:Enoyl-CoA hydratase-related protein n=1 Tax=Dactylosporangium fulvum TaxID=53359 RepID=A0ABY5VSG1_9ACTN|nr:enoyl-CoA hydratase-related protein [Dactylosporangium fulvum]UWP79756.1 enoyl-CoA hydratase-related protein [Dactylosporangium fulvum]